MHKRALIFSSLFFVFNLFFSCNSTSNRKEEDRRADEKYTELISVYTSGRVSSNAEVVITLAQLIPEQKQRTSGLLSISPNAKGTLKWADARTIVFEPSTYLENGQIYQVALNLDDLGLNITDDTKLFEFSFEVIEQDFSLQTQGVSSDAEDPMRLQQVTGVLQTADRIDETDLENSLKADQGGKELSVNWSYDESNGTSHSFVITGAVRQEDSSQLSFSFNGKSFGVDRSTSGTIEIPALNDFKVLNATIVKEGEPYLLLNFSDPLNEAQDLNGMIVLEGEDELRFEIDNGQVKAYTSALLTGSKKLTVYSGIKNRLNYAMPSNFEDYVSFEQIPPAVKLKASGTILPSTDGLVLPFEAINLKAVSVTVIKVFEKNIVQFLQANDLKGNSELRRVGKPVHSSRVLLDEAGLLDLSDWNQFKLDLTELIETEPGAIYQVRLNFKKADAAYICEGSTNIEEVEIEGEIDDDWASNDGEGFGTYESYYTYAYGPGYDWQEVDNPCHVSYYMNSSRTVSTNILASDLGVLAKIGNDRKLDAFVTDLRTTDPLSRVKISAYDYQGEVIAQETTDQEGRVEFDLPKKPFVLVAERAVERGYLKLWDANALSVSNFNVGGDRVKRGIQGFIYGERGVWRPGDDIYLNFILKDSENALPKDHPVIMELIDPSGRVKSKKVKNRGVNGFYHFPLKTDENDPTGYWLAKVTVGGNEYTKSIKIETVKPNRLRIDLDFGKESIKSTDRQVSGDLNVEWLSGASARNLNAEFDLSLSPMKTTFKGFENYQFDDKAKSFYSEKERIFSGVTDAKGNAKVNVRLGSRSNSPGALRATFSGKVFEPGGDFSIDQFSIPYYPFDRFVGISKPEGDSRGQLLTNKNHQIQIVMVDADGRLIKNGSVNVDVFKLNWRWWWDNSSDNLSYYVGRNYNSKYLTGDAQLDNGKATFNIQIPNNDWGRYYLRVTDPVSGHSTGTIAYFDWPGWAGKERPGGEAMLDFSTNAENFEVGDEIQVRIPASTDGRALISIENGTKVVDAFWLETNEGQNEVSFKATEEMVPNAFVNATLLQPHAQTANDLPMRLYGIIPIQVSDPSTVLAPEIITPEMLAPESKVAFEVREENGEPMTYTIAVVDEGLLDITNFTTPDPWKNFYARQALGVKTWDIYDDVIGSFKGELSRLLALGGDGSAQKPKNAKANRFKPVVKHLGPFELEAGATAEHQFEMPNYVGSVKMMIVAGNGRAFGKTEKATPVRKPVMVLGTLPRVLGPGEKIKLPINVFAMEKGIENVQVKLVTNDMLNVLGQKNKDISFDDIGDQTIDFELEVAERLGVAEVLIEASSGREKATYKIEVQVRNANPAQTSVAEYILQAGESFSEMVKPLGMEGTNSTILELSSIPAIDLGKRLDYLISYPHGCIEQTTSSVFPQLFLSDLVELSPEQNLEVSQKIKAGIQRIGNFQTVQGGFSYWPGQSDNNDWGTSYVGHFLLEAKDKGYFVPTQLMNKWRSYQRKKARAWSRGNYNDDLAQAYRLYTLALAQSPELGAMNRLREDADLSKEASWRLAAAYALTGRKSVADELIDDANAMAETKNSYYYYGSVVRDNALRLETLGLLGKQTSGTQLLRKIASDLSDDRWMSTQTTAYALLSIFKFAGGDNGQKGFKAEYVVGADKGSLSTTRSIKMINSDKQGTMTVSAQNTGENVLFARVIRKGQPLAGKEKAETKGLRMSVKYTNRNGTIIQPSQLEQGQDFFVEVNILNNGSSGDYKDLALTQVFPAGWEILNDRLNEISGAKKNTNIDYQDTRDDRVMSYFDLEAGRSITLKLALNATYAGEYYLPGVKVEAMYDDTIYARNEGQWVSIARAK